MIYLIQDALLQMIWVAPSVSQWSDNKQFWVAFLTATVALIPKAGLAYFIMYRLLSQFVAGPAERRSALVSLAIASAISVFISRTIYAYVTLPVFYEGLIKTYHPYSLLGILISVMDTGFVAGTATAIKLLVGQLRSKEREKELVRDKLETELKFLRQQTSPHFLFNTLNNIYALARKKSDNTADVVLRLSSLLRFMLYESRQPVIRIADELNILDGYIELERIRYNHRLSIAFNREIDDPNQKLAPLILLPFVENAFKHGISESRFDSFIHMNLQLKGEKLEFRIENSKENGEAEKLRENIGLSNVRRQLELLYPEHELRVNNHTDRFEIHLSVNLNSHAKI
ncbi:putative two-component histidine kinase [Flavihumibacter petaseus NBRC 106054]|uniref:Putative two-component histidine kinase n=1 Tax=Flavihumibacter petaseus NBRC 106054 TaxID=1220578 RepID=A0A0E9N6P4_9BACT|nr:putative two-component histidine kinase [Flavihumibacter petaseus NBRC 106054]